MIDKELNLIEVDPVKTSAVRKYFNKFFKSQSTGGILLLACALIALIIANVPSLSHIKDMWGISMGIEFGDFSLKMPLLDWVNDGLMAVFFFVVGLEIKREMMVGELSSIKQATLPVFAALGGMIFPALIYSIFNMQDPASSHGWGIPMATDIAFAIGVISLLGNRVPMGIKVMLTALAIVDDLGAIIVLAIFYPTHALDFNSLLIALSIFAFLMLMNKLGVKKVFVYVIGGVFMWYFVYCSGIHATIAGVLLAITIPHKTTINEVLFIMSSEYDIKRFKEVSDSNVSVLANHEQQHILHRMSENLDKMEPLMHKLETKLQPLVNFVIMPLFALANAGVLFSMDVFSGGIPGVSLGIFFGLLFGKPIGIFLFSLISVKLKLSDLPSGVKWKQVFAMGILGGIGFTMSIFIDNLAFKDIDMANLGKVSILLTSFTAALVGLGVLHLTTKHCKQD
ncbi:MAG: Na+/H+ antiporter NhaA [Bacteroidales bacterium]|nr:Na+/H+ antiporter NhaA [Bacteroidales bacterium]MDD4669847.1 Na+/H+ antiporter NhaA [Bacteroidales bacterium]